jgi:pSer/pThr/pTyr-binding forkhead associated (FHA) protein
MFSLEIQFKDGISPPETIFVRRAVAIIGSGDYAHVVIEGANSSLVEIEVARGLGRKFSCHSLDSLSDKSKGSVLVQEENYVDCAMLDLGDVSAYVTPLDVDLRILPDEPPEQASLRVLRRALTKNSPTFPAIALIDGPPLFFSFSEDLPLVIGRSRRCGFRIDASDVSAEHVRIGYDNEGYWLEDLGSTNGTFVNGDRVVARRILKTGDSIVIGADHKLALLTSQKDFTRLTQQNVERRSSTTARFYPCILSTSEFVRPSRFVFFRSDKISIGRDPANDIWVGAPHISRKHSELSIDERGRFIIVDHSSNGTFLNGVELPKEVAYELPSDLPVINFGTGIKLGICKNDEEERRFLSEFAGSSVQESEQVGAFVDQEQGKATDTGVQEEVEKQDVVLGQELPGVFHEFTKNQLNISAANSSEVASELGGNDHPNVALQENYLLDPGTEFKEDEVEAQSFSQFGQFLVIGLLVVLSAIVVGLFIAVFHGQGL